MASISSYPTKSGTRYQVQYRTPDRRLTKKRGFTTKKAAQKFAAEVELSKDNGTFIHPMAGRITVDEVHTLWLPGLDNLAPRTKSASTSSYNVHVSPKWGEWPVGRITSPEVRKWVADMHQEGKKKDTILRALHVLRAILDVAVEAKKIPSNPVQKIKVPGEIKKRRPYLTAEQVTYLANAMHTENDQAIVYTLAYCGLRINELAALNVEDFNPNSRRLSIAKAVKGRGIIGQTKTYETRRTPLPEFLVSKITALAQDRPATEPLFLSPEGMRVNSDNYRKRIFETDAANAKMKWKEDGKTAPFPLLTPHSLRHTCASLAISVGANVKAVQALLGHRDASVTLNTYSDLFPDDLDDVAGALNKLHNAVE